LEGTPNTSFTPKNNDDVQVKKRGRKTERKGKDKKKKMEQKKREKTNHKTSLKHVFHLIF
jgi:hypothetical protein